jgi:hypothetical protein
MGNVTVTVRTVDDEAVPAPIDGVLVRVFDSVGAFLASGTTGAVTPGNGEVDFTLNGEVAGEAYTVILSKDGVSFPPAPSKAISVTDPPNPNNTFQFTGHVGMVGQLVTFVVKDDAAALLEDVEIRVFDTADTYLTSVVTDSSGEASLVLDGAASPGLEYIIRIVPLAGYTVQTGATQRVLVIDPLGPSETNVFDFVLDRPSEVPETTDPRMCRLSGYFVDPAQRPLRRLTLMFHPREEHPDFVVSGFPYSATAPVVNSKIIASELYILTDDNGYAEVDLPRGAIFDVFVSGLSAPDIRLLSQVYIPDAAGVSIRDVFYPYVTKVTYSTATVAIAVDEETEVDATLTTSNLQPDVGLEGLVEFTSDDEDVATVVIAGGALLITGIAAGTATISAARVAGSYSPRLPDIPALIELPSSISVTVS